MFSLEQYQAVHTGAGLLDRRERGRLRLTGADRRGYLQGLLTNDIAALDAGAGCYALFLTAQGRMISDMRVSELGDALLIDLPGRTADTVRQRFSDFIFSEDVEVADARETLAHFGLYGPAALDLLAPSGTDPVPIGGLRQDRDRLGALSPDQNLRAPFAGGDIVVVRSDDLGVPGFELFVAGRDAPLLVRALHEAGAIDVSPETMAVCRIEAGRPEFGVDMDEHTIPLEAGIEDRAISLTKGCYVGQEIIIRVLHRGQGRVAKRLVGLVADRPFRPGEALRSDAGRDVGVVTSAADSPALHRPIGLGYVHRESTEPGTGLLIGPDANRRATVVTLPFVRPSATE